MDRRIKVILYGSDAECREAADQFKVVESLSSREHEWYTSENLDEFEAILVERQPTLAIILADGAAGMEGVYLSKSRRPDLPVFWFSDDSDFGIHSHRLNCAYFATKPITSEKIDRAIQRCIHIGISLDAQ